MTFIDYFQFAAYADRCKSSFIFLFTIKVRKIYGAMNVIDGKAARFSSSKLNVLKYHHHFPLSPGGTKTF
jgi:hypothetical protein